MITTQYFCSLPTIKEKMENQYEINAYGSLANLTAYIHQFNKCDDLDKKKEIKYDIDRATAEHDFWYSLAFNNRMGLKEALDNIRRLDMGVFNWDVTNGSYVTPGVDGEPLFKFVATKSIRPHIKEEEDSKVFLEQQKKYVDEGEEIEW